MAFTDQEIAYLQSQRLARLATVDHDGQPDVVPVGYEFNGDRFFIAGMPIEETRKYRNITTGNTKVALVVDDIASTDPWIPRSVRVYGTATAVQREERVGPGKYLQVTPVVSWSMNLDAHPLPHPPGSDAAAAASPDALRPHKTVHQSRCQAHQQPGHRLVGADDWQAIADRVEIEALRGEFADAGQLRDYDRFASLFTHDGAWMTPYINIEFVTRPEIRSGVEQMQNHWDYFVQTSHPGTIHLDGDYATGRAYIVEFGRLRDGRSQLHHSIYHDRYPAHPSRLEVRGASLRNPICRRHAPKRIAALPLVASIQDAADV